MGPTRRTRGPYFSRGSELLAEQLAARSLTLTKLAEMIGVTTAQVSAWLSGTRRPSLRRAVPLRDLLGLAVDVWHQPASPVVPPRKRARRAA